mmetsp:Transcript_29514/g.60514  ORF Transcript_29514/g.60514 Transcript_29514/m.60514 type:complete len:91 (+) Transcript_29514:597-869(+)
MWNLTDFEEGDIDLDGEEGEERGGGERVGKEKENEEFRVEDREKREIREGEGMDLEWEGARGGGGRGSREGRRGGGREGGEERDVELEEE